MSHDLYKLLKLTDVCPQKDRAHRRTSARPTQSKHHQSNTKKDGPADESVLTGRSPKRSFGPAQARAHGLSSFAALKRRTGALAAEALRWFPLCRRSHVTCWSRNGRSTFTWTRLFGTTEQADRSRTPHTHTADISDRPALLSRPPNSLRKQAAKILS